MKNRVIHISGRLEQSERTYAETPVNDIAERMLIEATRPPIDDLDVPAVLPDHPESEEVGDSK